MGKAEICFTEEERREMDRVLRKSPSLMADTDDVWWRDHFDKMKKKRMGNELGLDKKIANGITSYGETVSAEEIRDDCTRIMYAQTKARVFSILESQYDEGARLDAIKRVIEDVISGVSDNVDSYLRRSLIEGLKISE